jgi:hypothetical protein
MELPIFKSLISENDSDDLEVSFIAIVDGPAIKANFLAFKEQPLSFAITNEDEQIVTGLAMVADQPIYRRDKDGEFYVYFDASTIKKIAQRFFRKKYNFNLNLNHDPNYKTEDVYVFESWIVDREKGKPPMDQFKDVANGSWFISAKIDNPELWQRIKDGEFNGFSVEGFFNLQRTGEPTKSDEEQFADEVKKLLQEFEI